MFRILIHLYVVFVCVCPLRRPEYPVTCVFYMLINVFQGDQGGKDGENTYSTPNKDWPILQEFKQGQVMEIKAVMKAWHYVRPI